MKSKFISIFSLILLFCALFCACTANQSNELGKIDENTVIGSINGEEITQAEYEFFYLRQRSSIMRQFAAEFDINDFSSFWQNSYGGKSPQSELESSAFELAAKAKLILLEAKKRGELTDISFDGLKNQAEEYNRTHQNGAVGVKSINLDTFYIYYIENAKISLENNIESDADEYINDLYAKAKIINYIKGE